jgi:CheY-like chemotaxis protein
MNILLIEDNPGDVELMREALQGRVETPELTVARDGLEACELLAASEHRGALAPDLIILDLNMPRMDGREFLELLHEHPLRQRIPIVVLTSSNAARDSERALELGSDAYHVKPLDFGGFVRTVDRILDFRNHASARTQAPRA